jgi:hypothetical protein
MNGPKEPFGYKFNEETGQREVIPEQIKDLAKAAKYIDQGCGMQTVRDWLVNKTGRNISVPGLLKAIKYDKHKRSSTQRSPKETGEN